MMTDAVIAFCGVKNVIYPWKLNAVKNKDTELLLFNLHKIAVM